MFINIYNRKIYCMKLICRVLFGAVSFVLLLGTCFSHGVADREKDAHALVAVDTVKQPKSTKEVQPKFSQEGDVELLGGDNGGQFEEEFLGIKQELEKLKRVKKLHLQAQEIKQLRESIDQLRGESDSTKRDAIYKKMAKIVGGSVDQVGAILGIAVPVCTILLVFSFYRGLRNFFGLDAVVFAGRASQGGAPTQMPSRCGSLWSWMTDSNC